MARNDKKISEPVKETEIKEQVDEIPEKNKEPVKETETIKPVKKVEVPPVKPVIDRSNPVTIGAFFSTSKEIRKIEGFKYLKGAFEKKAKDFPYRQPMSKWESDFNKFLKG